MNGFAPSLLAAIANADVCAATYQKAPHNRTSRLIPTHFPKGNLFVSGSLGPAWGKMLFRIGSDRSGQMYVHAAAQWCARTLSGWYVAARYQNVETKDWSATAARALEYDLKAPLA